MPPWQQVCVVRAEPSRAQEKTRESASCLLGRHRRPRPRRDHGERCRGDQAGPSEPQNGEWPAVPGHGLAHGASRSSRFAPVRRYAGPQGDPGVHQQGRQRRRCGPGRGNLAAGAYCVVRVHLVSRSRSAVELVARARAPWPVPFAKPSWAYHLVSLARSGARLPAAARRPLAVERCSSRITTTPQSISISLDCPSNAGTQRSPSSTGKATPLSSSASRSRSSPRAIVASSGRCRHSVSAVDSTAVRRRPRAWPAPSDGSKPSTSLCALWAVCLGAIAPQLPPSLARWGSTPGRWAPPLPRCVPSPAPRRPQPRTPTA